MIGYASLAALRPYAPMPTSGGKPSIQWLARHGQAHPPRAVAESLGLRPGEYTSQEEEEEKAKQSKLEGIESETAARWGAEAPERKYREEQREKEWEAIEGRQLKGIEARDKAKSAEEEAARAALLGTGSVQMPGMAVGPQGGLAPAGERPAYAPPTPGQPSLGVSALDDDIRYAVEKLSEPPVVAFRRQQRRNEERAKAAKEKDAYEAAMLERSRSEFPQARPEELKLIAGDYSAQGYKPAEVTSESVRNEALDRSRIKGIGGEKARGEKEKTRLAEREVDLTLRQESAEREKERLRMAKEKPPKEPKAVPSEAANDMEQALASAEIREFMDEVNTGEAYGGLSPEEREEAVVRKALGDPKFRKAVEMQRLSPAQVKSYLEWWINMGGKTIRSSQAKEDLLLVE